MGLGVMEVIVIMGIALLVFGPSRLPKVGQSLGEAIRGFKQGLNEADQPAQIESQPPKESR